MSSRIDHFIAGKQFSEADTRTGPVFNPSTGREIARCAYGSRSTVDHAVQVATEAGRRWARGSHASRQAVIFKLRDLMLHNFDLLAEVIGREHGKTIEDAKGELGRAIEGIEFACGAPHVSKGEYANNVGGDIEVFSMRRPIGVVGCITPFNFPIMVPAVMMTMAVAVGNSVVWKPSEKVPSAAIEFARLWKEAGLPDGVFNVVQGDKEVVDAILEHPGIAGISFVGSTPVGEYIYQKGTSHNKRVAAFTGGKNHMIVMPDADLDAAASAFVSAGFGSSSQRCMAVSLLLPVGHETADRLLELVVPKIKALKVGAYDDPSADFGAVVSSESKATVEGAIGRCIEEGGQMVIDGRNVSVPGHPDGYYLGPTLFDRVTTDMQMYKEEIFGPVRGILRPATLNEAIDITNEHEYGNGSVIFTRDGKTAHRFMMEVESGMIGVNVPVPLPTASFNFGGLRRSKFGDGHLYGPDAARFYTKLKTISQRWPEPDTAALPISLAFNPAG
ncbi:CoA-acylating methylmalonate-semialdehyde dehydrogenase [Paraburkholderia phymatum]|uniref:Methylmalonate-semialdehyde dehydrogenase n=1 Tax=Paraburkholderia phymatum (strain DSM 17167 / CIP 108236 / LMG 21445 / STM815) TaxID=391038 RepID=B2JSK7_PARP8|nr:CoA-acylating methylmalonate-semialdehyde dehydrogenase [Paraburkholderia phymatum]ACC74027.1 methylmalonate-semialdehyde dehydrogenase [Paraburkholderia phymatum STM815]